MSFFTLPPEINSLRMFIGAGSAPMLAAAAAWDGLAEELGTAARSFLSVTTGLAGQAWQGPAAAAMLAAAAPYAGWLSAAATQSAGAAGQARALVSMFEAAQAATVLPAAVAANRDAFVQLVMSNLFGQNAGLIAAAEGIYEEMWAADVAAMSGYYSGASSVAAQLVPWANVLRGLPALAGGAVGGNSGGNVAGGASLGAGTHGDTNVGVGSGGDTSGGVGSGGVGSGGSSSAGGGTTSLGSPDTGAGNVAGDPNYGNVAQGSYGSGSADAGNAVGGSVAGVNMGVGGLGMMAVPFAMAVAGANPTGLGGTNSGAGNTTVTPRAPEPAAASTPEVETPEVEAPAPHMGVLSTADPEIAAKAAPVSVTRVTQKTSSGIPGSTLRRSGASEAASAEEEQAPSLRPETEAGRLRPRAKPAPGIQVRGG
ncbi:PPE family protein [Mycobacterium lacus]|uniref:PPE family protein PPE52 n=1 Tax=Mycobacterium lacus TaxID=169765 RepID=A0A1X1Y1T3_9MYCO|nr:PPE family protein [Mycobacterium lacus]MCV7122471.1 PPE domain-containing protein [Mycobacterium lacus]ORW05055.1 hypothetical protein AWC15_02330 [Mycobacterium lacus]BBX95292.1 PPE family protein PPE52 [Mycobacterium lacus]